MWEARLKSQLEGDVGAWGRHHTACKALACQHHEAGACPEPCLPGGQRGEGFQQSWGLRDRSNWPKQLVQGHLLRGYLGPLVTRMLSTQKSRQHLRLGPIIPWSCKGTGPHTPSRKWEIPGEAWGQLWPVPSWELSDPGSWGLVPWEHPWGDPAQPMPGRGPRAKWDAAVPVGTWEGAPSSKSSGLWGRLGDGQPSGSRGDTHRGPRPSGSPT